MQDGPKGFTLRVEVWEMQGKVLERTVPIAQTQTDGDTELTLHSLELYDDGFIVRYVLVVPEEIYADCPLLLIDAKDDLGNVNEYHFCRGQFAGDGRVYEGEARFTPALDPGARRVKLGARIERTEGIGQPTTNLGKHEFVVPLT